MPKDGKRLSENVKPSTEIQTTIDSGCNIESQTVIVSEEFHRNVTANSKRSFKVEFFNTNADAEFIAGNDSTQGVSECTELIPGSTITAGVEQFVEINAVFVADHNASVGIKLSRLNVGKLKQCHRLFRQACFQRNLLQTVCVYYNFILLGWIYGQLGTAFQDMQLILQTNVQQTSLVFTMNSVGYMIGCLLIGGIYNRVNTLLLLGILSILNGIANAILPWCTSFGLFLAMRLLGGILCGALDSGGNAKVASCWNSEGRQFMQALHFAYAFGGIISPLVTRLFLAPRVWNPEPSNMTSHNTVNTSFGTTLTRNLHVNTFLLNEASQNFSTTKPSVTNDTIGEVGAWNRTEDSASDITADTDFVKIEYGESRIHTAFVITGVLMGASGLLYILLFIKRIDRVPPYTRVISGKRSDTKIEVLKVRNRVKMNMIQTCIFISVLALSVLVYSAVECKLQSFLMPFVLMQLNWTKDSGAFVISLLWAFYGVGRFCGIPISRFIAPSTMIISYLSLNMLASLVMLAGAILHIDVLIWIGVPLSGWAISVIFPTFIVWTDENAMAISGKMAAFFLFTGALGFMIDPLYIGALMEQASPMYFVYLQIGETGMSLIVFFILLLGIRYLRNQ